LSKSATDWPASCACAGRCDRLPVRRVASATNSSVARGRHANCTELRLSTDAGAANQPMNNYMIIGRTVSLRLSVSLSVCQIYTRQICAASLNPQNNSNNIDTAVSDQVCSPLIRFGRISAQKEPSADIARGELDRAHSLVFQPPTS